RRVRQRLTRSIPCSSYGHLLTKQTIKTLRSTYQTQPTCATMDAGGRRPRLDRVQCTFNANGVAKMVADTQGGLRRRHRRGDRPTVLARSSQPGSGEKPTAPRLAHPFGNPLSPGTGFLGAVLVSAIASARSAANRFGRGPGLLHRSPGEVSPRQSL